MARLACNKCVVECEAINLCLLQRVSCHRLGLWEIHMTHRPANALKQVLAISSG